LGAMAMYNDKGHEWSRHSPEQVLQTRQTFNRELERLIGHVGRENIPMPVLELLLAEDLSSDASGRYAQSVRRLLERSGHSPS
ncbi:MAG: hypothetical protein ACRCUF_16325, partial [Aeromonas sobria]